MSEILVFREMLDEIERGEPIFQPSAFWRDLNSKNLAMIETEGLRNFKRTVSQNYFNWLIADANHPMFRHAFLQWLRHPNLLPFTTRLSETQHLRLTTSGDRIALTARQRLQYRLYVCFVWTIMMQEDRHGLRFKLAEPSAGNPFPITHGDRILTQDLASSIIECNLLADLPKASPQPRIAEVGAGYGRLAHAFAASQSGQYVIFDIPPALGVAQWYLEQALGPERVFRFRHFERFEDIQGELAQSSVALMTANQIRKFPDGYFDVTLTISTLPEMRQDQVDLYVSEFQRLSRGHIFIKQWKSWKNPNDGTDLTPDSYKLDARWRVTLDRTDPVIPMFFNRVWSKI